MRFPKYFSHSAFACYEKDQEEFYVKYLSELRAPRIPQERPAALGSGFDARAKSSLHSDLFGPGSDPAYEFDALYEKQVEPQNRDWALPESEYAFECYKYSGMYNRLLELMQKAVSPPRFEFDVYADIGGVPTLCKPDAHFVLPGPLNYVHDWKCNGYCSKSATSPNKGYQLCRDGESLSKPNKSHDQAHKLFESVDLGPVIIDAGYFEDISESWADQLMLYSWSLGNTVGDENVVIGIHQITAKPIPDRRPMLRVSEFRRRVRAPYQHLLLKRFQKAWHNIISGHPLHQLSREDNDARIALLEQESVGLQTDGSTKENFFAECVRPAYRG